MLFSLNGGKLRNQEKSWNGVRRTTNVIGYILLVSLQEITADKLPRQYLQTLSLNSEVLYSRIIYMKIKAF